MTSGATAGSVRDLFFCIKGSSGVSEASSSSSASPDGGRDGATAVLGAAAFLEEVAALFLVAGAGVAVLPEAPTGALVCLGPDFCTRSWSGSSSMRVLIHPWVIKLSSVTRARTSLASSGKDRAVLIRSSCSAVTEVRMKEFVHNRWR